MLIGEMLFLISTNTIEGEIRGKTKLSEDRIIEPPHPTFKVVLKKPELIPMSTAAI